MVRLTANGWRDILEVSIIAYPPLYYVELEKNGDTLRDIAYLH